MRSFAGNLRGGISQEFGQGALEDEEFLPDQEDLEMQLRAELDSSVTIANKSDDQLKHNEDVGGMIFKYDLPVENLAISFKNAAALVALDEANQIVTATQNLMDELECDKDTAFESFIIKHHQCFNNEVDMYGDIQKAGDSSLKVLEFGVPIPFEFVADDEKMTKVRSMFRVNTDIPGSLEVVHPNKFLPNLRPIEEFRHTPLIPISERDLKKYKDEVEQKNRKGYYVEIRKDTIYFYTISLLTLGTLFYAFLMMNEKQMRIKEDIERSKTLRGKASAGRKGANLSAERDLYDDERGSRKMF